MNLWDESLDLHHIDLTSKDLCEGFNVLCDGSKDLYEGSKPCRSTPPHLTAVCPPFSTGHNPMDFCEGSATLTLRPNPPHSTAAWIPPCTGLSSIPEGFNAHLPWLNCSYNSHASILFVLSIMSSLRSLPHPHSPLGNARSVFYVISLERILLDVIARVDEGILQKIPWESLLLTRVFVK